MMTAKTDTAARLTMVAMVFVSADGVNVRAARCSNKTHQSDKAITDRDIKANRKRDTNKEGKEQKAKME